MNYTFKRVDYKFKKQLEALKSLCDTHNESIKFSYILYFKDMGKHIIKFYIKKSKILERI
jgi:uncharacterized membrane protein